MLVQSFGRPCAESVDNDIESRLVSSAQAEQILGQDALGAGFVLATDNGSYLMAALDSLPPCPVETCVQLIGSKWRLLIIRDLLMNQTMRFGELQRSIGKISQKVLTGNLREMEVAGLVTRRVCPEVPPRVEYSLTETGGEGLGLAIAKSIVEAHDGSISICPNMPQNAQGDAEGSGPGVAVTFELPAASHPGAL